jgi:NAD(P)-dependent dehydrogenase (short-subunit alcohol dehydrogenase family)
MTDIWSYKGKRVVIAGCFSGMGEATAAELVRLGAEVHGVDIRPSPVSLASFTQVDLRDPASIASAVEKIGGEVDAVFNCAGLPNTFPAIDVVSVNFLGIRAWTELWVPKVRKGGAIASLSSTGGAGYLARLPLLKDFVANADFASSRAWLEAHAEDVDDGYNFSKEVLNLWTQQQAFKLGPDIRVNAVLPGSTDTPMMPAFEQLFGTGLIDVFTAPSGRRGRPAEQAYPLIFLNSDAASYISGVCLPVDGGFLGSATVGEIDTAALLAEAMGKE